MCQKVPEKSSGLGKYTTSKLFGKIYNFHQIFIRYKYKKIKS